MDKAQQDQPAADAAIPTESELPQDNTPDLAPVPPAAPVASYQVRVVATGRCAYAVMFNGVAIGFTSGQFARRDADLAAGVAARAVSILAPDNAGQ